MEKKVEKQPNIILINSDDLGYGYLGCYGSEVNDTPVLDQLAQEGVRFTDFYMPSPVSSPSRGAMTRGVIRRELDSGLSKIVGAYFQGNPWD